MADAIDSNPLRALLALSEQADEKQLLRAATQAVVALLGEQGSCVLTEDQPRVAFSTWTPLLDDKLIDLSRYPEITAALESGAPLAIDDVGVEPLFDDVRALRTLEMRSLVVVPLIAGSSKLGVLIAESASPRQAKPEELATAALIGQMTVRLLQLARLCVPTKVLRPRDRVPTPLARPRKAAHVQVHRARRILIVDDDAELAAMTAIALTREGYRTEVAKNGAECLARAQAEPPDLIVLDVMMPGDDGFVVAQTLSKDPLTSVIPLLFVSATRDLTERFLGLKLPAADFLAKPFSREDLVARVALALRQSDARARLLSDANLDHLTGLGNARHLQAQLAVEQARSERYGTSLAVLMIDFDRLKKFNDQHGHLAGSEALATMGDILLDGIRETDVAVRYGGDEFVVLLPHTTLVDGVKFAERTLAKVRQARPCGFGFSVSIGVAARVAATDLMLGRLFEEADAAVYRAKGLGGDRACTYSPDSIEATI